MASYTIEIHGSSNDSNVIVSSESAKIDYTGTANDLANPTIEEAGVTSSLNLLKWAAVDKSDYALHHFECHNLYAEEFDDNLKSRSLDEITSLYYVEDNKDGILCPCPGVCKSDKLRYDGSGNEVHDGGFCFAVWQDGTHLVDWNRGAYSYINDPSMGAYIKKIQDKAKGDNAHSSAQAVNGETYKEVKELIADLSDSTGTWTQYFQSVIDNGIGGYEFAVPADKLNFNFHKKGAQITDRWLKDIAHLKLMFNQGRFGLSLNGTENPNTRILAGVDKTKLRNRKCCNLSQNLVRQTRIFNTILDTSKEAEIAVLETHASNALIAANGNPLDVTFLKALNKYNSAMIAACGPTEQELEDIKNKLYADLPDLSNGNWVLSVQYGVAPFVYSRGAKFVGNAVHLHMCSSAPNSGYLVNTGEFFAGCSDEDNSVNFIRTKSTCTLLDPDA